MCWNYHFVNARKSPIFLWPYLPKIGFKWVMILLCWLIGNFFAREFLNDDTDSLQQLVKNGQEWRTGTRHTVFEIHRKSLIKMLKRPILVTFWNLLLAVKQCYQVGQFLVKILVNVTFWVIFKQCARQHNKKKGNNKKLSCSVLP